MKKILTLLILCLYSTLFFAQKSFFNKKLSNIKSVSANKIVAADNGSFIVAGRWIESISPYKAGSIICKISKIGGLIWSKQFLNSNNYQGITSIIALKNGGFAIAYDENQGKSYVTLTDENLTPFWTIETASSLGSTSNFNKIIELSYGNLAIIGYRIDTRTNFQVTVVNAGGTILWSKIFSNKETNVNTFVSALKETNDQQILLATNSSITTGSNTIPKSRIKLLKINAFSGSIVSQKELTVRFENYETVSNIIEDNLGNIFLQLNSFTFVKQAYVNINGIVKLDKNAKVEWFRNYGDSTMYLSSLIKKIDGNFLAIMEDNNKRKVHFLNLNKSGDITNQVKEESGGTNTSAAYTTDNNLIVNSLYSDCKNETSTYIQKRSANGEGKCSETSDLNVSNATITESNYFKEIIVSNGVNPKKVSNFSSSDYVFSITNETIFCQDTTSIVRCEGLFYEVGKKKYTKSGIYKDTISNFKCDSVILSKVKFISSNITNVDTFTCTNKAYFFNKKSYTKAGTYIDTLKNTLGCDSVLSINLKIKDLEIKVSEDVTVNSADATQLVSTSNFDKTIWKWSPSGYLNCSDCPDPISTPLQSTLYTVKGENKLGCTAEKTINVTVKPCNQVFIPNIFSPNDDTVNDTHTIFTTSCASKVIQYTIYDRWGNIIFNAENFPPSDTKFG